MVEKITFHHVSVWTNASKSNSQAFGSIQHISFHSRKYFFMYIFKAHVFISIIFMFARSSSWIETNRICHELFNLKQVNFYICSLFSRSSITILNTKRKDTWFTNKKIKHMKLNVLNQSHISLFYNLILYQTMLSYQSTVYILIGFFSLIHHI